MLQQVKKLRLRFQNNQNPPQVKVKDAPAGEEVEVEFQEQPELPQVEKVEVQDAPAGEAVEVEVQEQ